MKDPRGRLLHRYHVAGHYVDCFTRLVDRPVDLRSFVHGFYGSRLFALERVILGLFGLGATPADITRLADGQIDRFAAWRVEDRTESQLLLRDVKGATASWLAVAPEGTGTRLYFGSAVVLKGGRKPWWLRPILLFHTVYARQLLARARV